MHKSLCAAALAAALSLLPSPALAHSPAPGLAGFYSGLLHPLTTPGQLLALLALGLMLGFRWPRWFGWAILVFAIALLIGIGAGQLGFLPIWAESALLIVAVLSAALAALYPSGIPALFLLASGVCGVLIGLVSTPDPGPAKDTAISLAGCFAGANLALLYVSGASGWVRERFDKPWVPVGLRIAAAWIATIAALSALIAITGPRP